MLNFFREKAAVIGWSIIIFFAFTMLAGSFYLGFFDSTPRTQQVQPGMNNFASMGTTPVNVSVFNQIVQTNVAQVYQSTQRVSPIQLEYIIINAFQSALKSTASLIDIEGMDISVSKAEQKAMLREFLIENNLESEKALKKILKERNVPFKQFLSQLDNELLIRKYKNSVISAVQVSDEILYNVFKSVSFNRVIVVNLSATDEQYQTLVNGIKAEIEQSGIAAVKEKYKDVLFINEESSNGFYSYFDLTKEARDIVYSLDKGMYSEPVSEQDHYALFQLEAFKIEEKPEGFDKEAFSTQLLTSLRNEALEHRFVLTLEEHPLQIFLPELKAVYEKYNGNFEGALNAYQEVISNRPSTPVPHFFRADIYSKIGNEAAMMAELEKADLKSEIDAESAFPELHIFYADKLKSSDKAAAIQQLDKALALIDNDENFLNGIKNEYQALNHNAGVTAVDKKLKALEAAKKAAEEAAAADSAASSSDS